MLPTDGARVGDRLGKRVVLPGVIDGTLELVVLDNVGKGLGISASLPARGTSKILFSEGLLFTQSPNVNKINVNIVHDDNNLIMRRR